MISHLGSRRVFYPQWMAIAARKKLRATACRQVSDRPHIPSNGYAVRQHGKITREAELDEQMSYHLRPSFAQQSRNAKPNTWTCRREDDENAVPEFSDVWPAAGQTRGGLFYRSVEPPVLSTSEHYTRLAASFPWTGTPVPGHHPAQANRRSETNCFADRPTSLGAGNNGHEPDRRACRPHRSPVV
jgi:hypothetical protein